LDDRIVGDAGMMRYLGRRSHAASIGRGSTTISPARASAAHCSPNSSTWPTTG
jgi:hypothetical protein